MACQLLPEIGVGDSVEGFTEVRVHYIHSLSSVTWVMKGDQVGQALPSCPKPWYWLGLMPWLSCKCHVMALKMTFPSTAVWLPGL